MNRKEAKEYVTRHCNPDYPKGKTEWETAINMAIDALSQPEQITCKDCNHCTFNAGAKIYCDELDMRMYQWDYCSRAERREE